MEQTSIEAYTKVISDISRADQSKTIASNVTINGIFVGNAITYCGVTTGNLRDIVTALGGNAKWNRNAGVATIEIKNKNTGMWEKITYNTKTMINGIGTASDGTPFTATDGHLQAGVCHMAQIAGVDDIISWWIDNGTPTITIQTDMKNAPVQVTRAGNDVSINAYLQFTGNAANKLYPGESAVSSETGLAYSLTYKDVVMNTIQSKWSGIFNVYGQNLNVNTRAHTKSDNKFQRYLKYKINFGNEKSSSYAGKQEDIFITGIGGDQGVVWNMADSSGRITVNINQKIILESWYSNHIKSTFAHEFGHAMGIGDAYNAWYRTTKTMVPRRPVDGKRGIGHPQNI